MATTSEDRDEIRDLYARYCLSFDRGAAAEWAAMYTDDGEFVGAGQHLVGRQALEDFLAELPTSTRHRITCNHVIDVDRDRAACTSSVVLLDGGAIVSTGRAVDELQRIDGRWHIARRVFEPDAISTSDLARD